MASIEQPFTNLLIYSMKNITPCFIFSASLKRPSLPVAHLSLNDMHISFLLEYIEKVNFDFKTHIVGCSDLINNG